MCGAVDGLALYSDVLIRYYTYFVLCAVYIPSCYRMLAFQLDVSSVSSVQYRVSRPIRRNVIFSLGILEKNDECILILVIYWKITGLLHTKISNHNIIYSS